jgi:Protein of unknown function (DUF2971)
MGDLIYKYCRRHGVRFIQNRKLKFSPPIDFDDPFELRPRPGDSTLSIDDSNILLNDDLRMRTLYEPTKSTISFKNWLRPRRDDPKEFNRELARVMPKAIEDYCPGALASVSKEYGMACFSETPADIRMWSHYADEHKGVVVGLDTDLLGLNLLPVKYTPERIPFTASQFANPQIGWVVQFLTTKSEDWTYQREQRAVLAFGKPPLEFDNELGGHAFQIPGGAMKRVLVGCNATPQTVVEVQNGIATMGLSLTLEMAKPHRSAFAMEFALIKPN